MSAHSSLGAGFYVLIRQYLYESVKTEKDTVSYREFKARFIDFVNDLMEENGDMFYVRYPLINYEVWAKKHSEPNV